MSQKQYLTIEGKKQIEEKLDFYKRVRRPEVVKKLGIAREFGDLSENAEYDAAKDEQALVESEIKKMEDLLLNAIIIDKSSLDGNKVEIGTKVKLYDEEFDEEVEYSIVGTNESDPKKYAISNESPLGAALLGHKKGEYVTVSTPSGSARYKILEINI